MKEFLRYPFESVKIMKNKRSIRRLLLNSHEEFLRPYFILPFKTEVLLNYKDNEQTTEKLILVNATFEDKKEELSKLIPHINFNI